MLILKGHTNSIHALAYLPDGRHLVSGGDDRTVRIWDVYTGKEVARLGGVTDSILSISVHLDGRRIAAGGHDRRVQLWKLDQPEKAWSLCQFQSTVNAVAFSPDGDYLACGADRNTGTKLCVMKDDGEGVFSDCAYESTDYVVWSLAFSPDSTMLAVAWGSGMIELLEVETWESQFEFNHPSGVTGLAYAPDGRILAALSGNTVTLWDLVERRLRMNWEQPLGRLWSIAFTPDGRHIATAAWDSTVRLWDVATGREKSRFNWGLGKRINTVAFAPDGMTAAVGGDAPDIVIWDVDDV